MIDAEEIIRKLKNAGILLCLKLKQGVPFSFLKIRRRYSPAK